MIGRIESQNEISYSILKNKGISFPHQRLGKTVIYPLPSDSEINATIAKAKEAAIMEASRFGMFNTTNIDEFKIPSNILLDCEDDFIDEETEDEHEHERENDWNNEAIENQLADENINESSPLTVVYDEDGNRRIVRKSTLVWMLCEPSETLSKDRLRRVQAQNAFNKKRKINENNSI